MADFLQISQKTYSHLENDKIEMSLSRLKKVAEVFEVGVVEILSHTDMLDRQLSIENDQLSKNTMETKFYHAISTLNEQLEGLRQEIRLLKRH